MRIAMIAIIPALCALLALPVSAQHSPDYQPTSASEKQQLEERRDPEMADLRGGERDRRAALNDAERERIEKMVGGQVQRVEMLRSFRAGDRVHVHWGVWVAIPSACGTVLLILLLVLLLV